MNVNNIKEVLKLLKSTNVTESRRDPISGKIELAQTVRIDPKYSIVKKMTGLETGSVDLDNEEVAYLKDSIPEVCSDYIHYNGKFFFIDYKLKRLSLVEKPKENVVVFDYNHTDFDNLGDMVYAAANLIETGLLHYYRNSIYKDSRYTLVKTVEAPSDKYYHSYSMTKEESDKMFELRKTHNKKYHKKGFGYGGASPVSNFEVRFGACSIGTWCDCVCLECEKEYKRALEENPNDKKKLDKLKKQMTIEIRGIDE